MASTYLDRLLGPLHETLSDATVTDVYINRPGEMFVETLSTPPTKIAAPALSEEWLLRLVKQIAAWSSQGVSRSSPLLSASLPDGVRVQAIVPPASREFPILALRRQAVSTLDIEAFGNGSNFAEKPASNAELHRLAKQDRTAELMRKAVLDKKNILISGGTSSGKTTFLNSLLAEIPRNERLVLIEDTAELHCPHENSVGLLCSRSALAEAQLTAEDLLIASLRLRPDRILLGEIRGSEAFTFLRAINSGHPGSITTIHADSPERAVEQLAMLVLQSGSRMRREDVVAYVEGAIDLFVQLGRKGGKRAIEAVIIQTRQSTPSEMVHVS